MVALGAGHTLKALISPVALGTGYAPLALGSGGSFRTSGSLSSGRTLQTLLTLRALGTDGAFGTLRAGRTDRPGRAPRANGAASTSCAALAGDNPVACAFGFGALGFGVNDPQDLGLLVDTPMDQRGVAAVSHGGGSQRDREHGGDEAADHALPCAMSVHGSDLGPLDVTLSDNH